jgi:hypothetical protein
VIVGHDRRRPTGLTHQSNFCATDTDFKPTRDVSFRDRGEELSSLFLI